MSGEQEASCSPAPSSSYFSSSSTTWLSVSWEITLKKCEWCFPVLLDRGRSSAVWPAWVRPHVGVHRGLVWLLWVCGADRELSLLQTWLRLDLDWRVSCKLMFNVSVFFLVWQIIHFQKYNPSNQDTIIHNYCKDSNSVPGSLYRNKDFPIPDGQHAPITSLTHPEQEDLHITVPAGEDM